jgi:acyl carrier protein
MDIDQFIKDIEEEYEDIEPGKLKPEHKLKDYFEWNSINALIMIAMVSTNYDVTLTADDMNKVTSIKSLYEIVNSRM